MREGLIITDSKFDYDRERYGVSLEELGKSTAFTVPVVVGQARLLRTRAKFDEWSCTFIADCDDDLVDQAQLKNWLSIAGQRIGLGDWRPAKSGHYGRFEVDDVQELGA